MGREETAGQPRRGLTRPPVAAGTFYPADVRELRLAVDGLLDEVSIDVD